MSEGHAYGRSFFCVSRRLFLLALCFAASGICFIGLGRLVLSYIHPQTRSAPDCVGMQCYEVLSCFGLKDSTLHIRRSALVFGAYFFSAGIYGLVHGLQKEIFRLACCLAVLCAIRFVVLAADGIFVTECDAYPTNVIHESFLEWIPPSPLSSAAQARLSGMSTFPVKDVQDITSNFSVLAWYFLESGCTTALLIYAAVEACLLAEVVELGPVGMGAHFGLAQWDEVLNHEGLRHHRQQQTRSKFLDDATLPFAASGLPVYGSLLSAATSKPRTLQKEIEASTADAERQLYS